MKRRKIMWIAVFYLTLSLLGAVTLFGPVRSFSENENRPLAEKPAFTIQGILNSDFQKEFEEFIGDQVPLRENGIQLSTFLRKSSGKKEISDLYIGKDDYYFRKFTDDSYTLSRLKQIFDDMAFFSGKNSAAVTVMPVPSAGTILRDKLPANAPYYEEEPVFSTISEYFPDSVVDLRECFLANRAKTQLYYRTDHHWTTDGAYLAYTEYCRHKGLVPEEKGRFNMKQVSDNFYGTLYSKLLDSSAKPDSIFLPFNLPKVSVCYDRGDKTDSPYDLQRLDTKDQYTVFFGGNYATVEIDTPVRNGKKLLIIKDSFANSLTPFLLRDYEKIVMLDLRYYRADFADVLSRQGFTDVLVLYEVTNILTEPSLARIKLLPPL